MFPILFFLVSLLALMTGCATGDRPMQHSLKKGAEKLVEGIKGGGGETAKGQATFTDWSMNLLCGYQRSGVLPKMPVAAANPPRPLQLILTLHGADENASVLLPAVVQNCDGVLGCTQVPSAGTDRLFAVNWLGSDLGRFAALLAECVKVASERGLLQRDLIPPEKVPFKDVRVAAVVPANDGLILLEFPHKADVTTNAVEGATRRNQASIDASLTSGSTKPASVPTKRATSPGQQSQTSSGSGVFAVLGFFAIVGGVGCGTIGFLCWKFSRRLYRRLFTRTATA